MRFFNRIVAFVLLALWMPATQYCGLEATGLIASNNGEESVACCDPATNVCAYDSCHVIEQFSQKTSNDSLQVLEPDFVACACFLCLKLLHRDLGTESIVAVAATDQPLGWVPTWHFARRAAPLPRAPAILV